jgi:hypothetical protein
MVFTGCRRMSWDKADLDKPGDDSYPAVAIRCICPPSHPMPTHILAQIRESVIDRLSPAEPAGPFGAAPADSNGPLTRAEAPRRFCR